MTAGIAFGKQKKIDSVLIDDDIKTKAEQEYICENEGNAKIVYRITYKNNMDEPPCEVFEINKGKTKKIAQSLRTKGVCESIVDRMIAKLETKGMICSDKTNND
jgi:hypothetical protein